MADALAQLVTQTTGLPDSREFSPVLDGLVEDKLNEEGFDPQLYLLEQIMTGEKQTAPDVSLEEAAIGQQMQVMLGLQDESRAVLEQLSGSSAQVSSATTESEEAGLAVELAAINQSVPLENELAELSMSRRNAINSNVVLANETAAAYMQDIDTVNAADDLGFLDFLKNPLQTYQVKRAGRLAERSAMLNREKLAAIDAVNKFQADSFISLGDSIQLEAKLRRESDIALYQQAAVKNSVLRQAVSGRQLSLEDAQVLGQSFGLSSNVLQGMMSSLNAKISVANLKRGDVEAMLSAAQLRQNSLNQQRIELAAKRSEDARSSINSGIQRAYDAMGVQYDDPNSLIEHLATATELGTITPVQQTIIGRYVLGSGVNAASMFESADPVGEFETLMQANPELVSDSVQQVMRGRRNLLVGGQALVIPPQVTDPKEIRAMENAHVAAWYAQGQADYNSVINTWPGSLQSPSDIPDYSKVVGMPAGVEDVFKQIKINTTSGESYFSELLTSLTDPRIATVPIDQLAYGAASISRAHKESLEAATGIRFQKMNIPQVGGDVTNPATWATRIEILRARAKARMNQNLTSAEMNNLRTNFRN
jgi:hypothetical protein